MVRPSKTQTIFPPAFNVTWVPGLASAGKSKWKKAGGTIMTALRLGATKNGMMSAGADGPGEGQAVVTGARMGGNRNAPLQSGGTHKTTGIPG